MFAHQGFTLVELVVVITIVGILAGGVALFIGRPTQSFFDTERRADLSDRADTALRRMARDIRNAVPNSVRTTGNGADSMLEFTPILQAGRYRAAVGTNAADNPLDFSDPADTGFNILGPAMTVANTDSLVIYNLGIAGADVYENFTNRRTLIGAINSNTLSFVGTGSSFPLASPSSRFYVVATPVTYACDMTNRELVRYQNYGYQLTQPIAFDPTLKRVLANNLTSCAITYTPGILQRLGIVTINLGMTEGTANITLMHQVNVANSP